MIVAICGTSPQVGKTTTAEYLQKKLGGLLAEISEPIQLFAEEYAYYRREDKHLPEMRKILQDIGYCFKQHDPGYWVHRALFCALKRNQKYGLPPTIEDMSQENMYYYNERFRDRGVIESYIGINPESYDDPNFFIFISGIRSEEEADEIKSLGGKVILVKRDTKEMSKNWHNHKVENQLSNYKKFDVIINNNKTIEDLYDDIDKKIIKGVLSECTKNISI